LAPGTLRKLIRLRTVGVDEFRATRTLSCARADAGGTGRHTPGGDMARAGDCGAFRFPRVRGSHSPYQPNGMKGHRHAHRRITSAMRSVPTPAPRTGKCCPRV